MYPRPQRIWVAGFVCQSGPALAIFAPGRACGIPYAPELGLLACGFHPLSAPHRLCRQPNWPDDQPNDPSMPIAICCGEPGGEAVPPAALPVPVLPAAVLPVPVLPAAACAAWAAWAAWRSAARRAAARLAAARRR